MKRIFIRLFILLNPIHPVKLSKRKKEILFKVCRRSKWFKRYFFHYMNYFGGYPVYITHKDNSKEKCFVLYYPCNNSDYSKTNIEVRRNGKRDWIEVQLKYLDIVKFRR